MEFKIDPTQYNYTCYIVGGGPSLIGFNWSNLDKNKFVIAINKAYEVLPDAQVVYFTDRDYWERHKERMLKHSGQLIRGALQPQKEEQHERVIFYKLTGKNGLETTPGCLKHGSNSMFAALQAAVIHWGFKIVYLLGADMKWDHSSKKATTHWHGGYAKEHGRTDNERAYNGFISAYQTIVDPLKKMKIEVYNINSPDKTDLKCFPIVSFEEAGLK